MPGQRRKSAFRTALQEAQKNGDTVIPLQSGTVAPLSGETERQQSSETVEKFYSDTAKDLNGETVRQISSDTVSPLNASRIFLEKSEEVKEQDSNTLLPLNSATATRSSDKTEGMGKRHTGKQFSSETVKKSEKISFYLTAEQTEKLDDLTHAYRKKWGKRINRNDLIRHLVDRCNLASFDDLEQE